MKAKSDEENKGGGAADARRWNGLRNVVESRALLKTAFRTASTLKAQVSCRASYSDSFFHRGLDLLKQLGLLQHISKGMTGSWCTRLYIV